MTRTTLHAIAIATLVALPATGGAQHAGHPTLHLNTRWKECSIQLSSSLTQAAWRQFTREAGLVTYFRPVTDARPMGAGNWEVSLLQWDTAIDDHDAAWNDTFVHPDSTHWLTDGTGLKFPGLTVRRGITDRVDVGGYVTQSPNANYGFYGAQVQVALGPIASSEWTTAARMSFTSMFGPSDLDFTIVGADLVASRTYDTRWIAISPYAGVSAHLSASHEKSDVVSLSDERVLGAQAMAGVVAQFSIARVGVEYNAASVRSLSIKVGVAY